jgi:hypothetical protein
MKHYYLPALSAIPVIILTACGGGGGGSDSVELTVLDRDTIDKFGTNVATATPGCDYTSDTVATSTYQPQAVAAYRAMIDSMKQHSQASRNANRVSDYADTLVGDCGGTMVISGEHDNGDDDLTYTYTNYCNSDGSGNQTVTNGVFTAFLDGHSTDSGPVVDRTLVSTQSSGISVVSTVNSETSTNTMYVSNLELNGADSSNTTLKADKIRVNDDGKDFIVSDLSLAVTDTGGSSAVQIKSITYQDPDNGAVKISTSVIPVGSGSTSAATITVIGADGTSATFKADDISTGLYTARDSDGNVVGALDCTGLASGS